MDVTKEEFAAYRRIQASGWFNMLDPAARDATGLDKATYSECIDNYGALEDKYGDD